MKSLRPVTAFALALVFVASFALARGGPSLVRADEAAKCPGCGTPFVYEVLTATNDAGGVDADGCRYAVGSDGRLFVPELREVVACPSSTCSVAFFRAHLALAGRLPRVTVADSSPLRDVRLAGTLAPRALVLARAIATYRATGLAPFGRKDDPQTFEGMLWLRAAWAVREAVLAEDDVRRLPFLFAPRTPAAASSDLLKLDGEFQQRLSSGGEASQVEDALAAVDEAREALSPLEPRDAESPGRALRFGQAVASLDLVERTLLDLKATFRDTSEVPGGALTPRELALALARAAHREGDGSVRDRWIERATQGREVPKAVTDAADRLKVLADAEKAPLARAVASLAAGAERATGDRRSELLVLAADAARRADDVPRARTLIQSAYAAATSNEAKERAQDFGLRLGEGK